MLTKNASSSCWSVPIPHPLRVSDRLSPCSSIEGRRIARCRSSRDHPRRLPIDAPWELGICEGLPHKSEELANRLGGTPEVLHEVLAGRIDGACQGIIGVKDLGLELPLWVVVGEVVWDDDLDAEHVVSVGGGYWFSGSTRECLIRALKGNGLEGGRGVDEVGGRG
jgi:hypothetical protein